MGVCMPEENSAGLYVVSNNNKKKKANSLVGSPSRASTKFSTTKTNQSYNFLYNINNRLSTVTRYENIRDSYIITNTVIGEGGSAIVYGAYDIYSKKKGSFDYAIKKVLKSNDKEINNQLTLEIEINKILHHNNIVKCYDIFEDDLTVYFVYEYMPDGDLFDYITSKPKHCIDENEIPYILEQILLALIYIHEKLHITHRDIKPENFMLRKEHNNKYTVKLMDFGTSDFNKKGGFLKTTQGTPVYIAPEVYLEKPYDSKVDMWSLGVVLYNMATGRHPFLASNQNNESMVRQSVDSSLDYSLSNCEDKEQKLVHEIISAEVDLSVFKTNTLKYLAKKLLEKEPEKRISAVEALDELNMVKTFFSKKSNTCKDNNYKSLGRTPVVYRQTGSLKSDMSLIQPKNLENIMTPCSGQIKYKYFINKENENMSLSPKKSLFDSKNKNLFNAESNASNNNETNSKNNSNPNPYEKKIKLYRFIDK